MVAAGWSNEATEVLIIVLGEQNIRNQLDGVARNNKSCVYEKVSAMQERGYEFSPKQCLRNCCFLLKRASFFFQLFSTPCIFFVLSPVCVCNAA